ncbi:hypothetical protein Goari_007124 [Gossypium aridum]|uniref:Uncharacterized protein n=1 Tax=Gossypium aridum TaxID=34290 RepID=A0A7J8XQ51_GOSAI|nr:hypothetical protein [Gossypium aridum]
MEYDEQAGDEESNIDEMSEHIVANMTIDDERSIKSASKPQQTKSKSKFNVQDSVSPEVVKPCGRINSCMVVGKDTLYIYGGMMEVKDQEITLDDLYSLNLSKLDEWKCIIPASESEWVEASEDEDDEDEDDDDDDSEDEGESGSGDEETDDDDEAKGTNDGTKSVQMGDAVALIRGEGKNLRRKEKRVRIEQIRANLGLSDSQRTPTVAP